ncbi:MAG: hypothetical protein K9K67_12470 [Bacteriovoracaceae bacterium]|nr:hypothetical protein [Bacteriovoracaceae bacterium]
MGKEFPQAFYWLVTGLTLLTASCTNLSFQGKGLIPLYLTDRPDHTKFAEVKGTKEFYLWGLIAPDQDVFLDEEFYKVGLVSASAISVHEFQRTSSFWKAFFSLGFYIPKDYVISAYGIEPGAER